jgi:DNA-binding transcriptional ArsR family regulator
VPITFDLEGARVADVTVGTSPTAELMAVLHALSEPEHHPHVRAWLARVREALSTDLAALLGYYSPLWARYRCRLLFPLALPVNRELPEEIESLLRLPEDKFLHLAAAAVQGTSDEVGDLEDDEAARHAFLKTCKRKSFQRTELAYALLADPRTFREGLTETLRRCDQEFFAIEWRRSRHRLAQVADRLGQRLRTEPMANVLASLNPSSKVSSHPPRIHFDKLQTASVPLRGRKLILLPSVHTWPHLMVKFEDDQLPVVVQFSASAWERRGELSLSLVRDRLAVLSDPARLALCRHLASEPSTTSELAARTGMTEPQVSRHVGRLRQVGLIRSERDGKMVYHRFASDVLIQLGYDVLATIVR